MWRDESPIRLNVVLSLLAVLMSLTIGLAIPALNSSSARLQTQTGWSHPSPTTTLTPSGALTASLASLDSVTAVDAADGALIAWQEPGMATPSTIPLVSPATSAATLPTADAPTPSGRGTAAPTSNATSTATPNPTATLSPTASQSPTPSATATAPATLSPTAAPSPTFTATSTATPPATATAKPLPVPPTRSPAAGVALASPAAAAPASQQPLVLPPALLQPALNARLQGTVQFEWYPTSTLPEGALYELVVWSPEQDPNQAWGVAPPRIMHSMRLNLDELFKSGRFREGSLYWTVLVVEENPYRRLTQPAESERRYLVLATGG